MATTAGVLIESHPTNFVEVPGYRSASNKTWTKDYDPILNITVHTTLVPAGAYWLTEADFSTAFLPQYQDDDLRYSEDAAPPNQRIWRMESEADCELWWHTEISNVVLAAWSRYPTVLQHSHIKPPIASHVAEEVDTMYTVKNSPDRQNGHRTVLVIGEFKRNLIHAASWQSGDISARPGQVRLSRELRGYARKYSSPQVFCFDGATLLMLQFQANVPNDIESPNCPVDCWVLPRETSMITLRHALYVLLRQGLRRFQGMRLARPPGCASAHMCL